MTVTSTYRVAYTGTGLLDTFAYGFKIQSATDLTVLLVTTATGAVSTQTYGVDYTVTGAGESGGGNVVMTTPPTSAQKLIIKRGNPLVQSTDYTENDAFPAETHELALDYLMESVQKLDEKLKRAVTVADNDKVADGEVEGTQVQANYLFRIDSAATGTEAVDFSDAVQFSGLNAVTNLDNTNDYVMVWDSSEGEPVKVLVNYFAANASGILGAGSNVGTGGVGVFKQVSGITMEFKNINAGSSKVTITDDTGNNEVDIDIVEANINHNSLSNYVANEHIDWTSTSSSLTTTGNVECTNLTVNGTLTGITYLVPSNNLSDLTSASTARTNLGLGTAATTAATDYIASTGDTGTGSYDFGGADSFEIPNGTSVTVDAAGEIAMDTDGDGTTVTTGTLRMFDGTNTLTVFGTTNYPTSDNDVMVYDSATNAVKWEAQSGAGGTGDAWSDPVDADIVPDADGTRDLGSAANRFAETHTDSLDIAGTTTVTGVLDEDNMASNSAVSLATQQSIKAYVDAAVASAGGGVVQHQVTVSTTKTSSSSTIPYDGSAPQNTEGTQYMTVTITPTSATNRLEIRCSIPLVNISAPGRTTIALFQDSTASALTTNTMYHSAANGGGHLSFVYSMAAGTTSATTFKIRYGGSTGTMAILNDTAGTGIFSTSCQAVLSVTEYVV